VDEWKEMTPAGGIETTGAEPIPAGLWIGEARLRIQESGGCYESFLEPYRVALEIVSGQETGSAFGLVVFGEGEPPPPVIDPEVGYPPDDDTSTADIYCLYSVPREGFAYRVRQGVVGEGGSFRFRIAVQELYEPWCALQTSYEDSYEPGVYSCLPPMTADEYIACHNLGPSWSPPSVIVECPIDHGRYVLCKYSLVCMCTREGCIANMTQTIRFDLVVDGNEMEGVVTNLSFDVGVPPVEVRLRRVR
jgi:hypothetical protein